MDDLGQKKEQLDNEVHTPSTVRRRMNDEMHVKLGT